MRAGTLTLLVGAGALPEVLVASPVPDVPAVLCTHRERTQTRHENADRVRVLELCERCKVRWHHCYAKQLDGEGREAWGPVGVWTTREELLGQNSSGRTRKRLKQLVIRRAPRAREPPA